jgi:hypothetical protein
MSDAIRNRLKQVQLAQANANIVGGASCGGAIVGGKFNLLKFAKKAVNNHLQDEQGKRKANNQLKKQEIENMHNLKIQEALEQQADKHREEITRTHNNYIRHRELVEEENAIRHAKLEERNALHQEQLNAKQIELDVQHQKIQRQLINSELSRKQQLALEHKQQLIEEKQRLLENKQIELARETVQEPEYNINDQNMYDNIEYDDPEGYYNSEYVDDLPFANNYEPEYTDELPFASGMGRHRRFGGAIVGGAASYWTEFLHYQLPIEYSIAKSNNPGGGKTLIRSLARGNAIKMYHDLKNTNELQRFLNQHRKKEERLILHNSDFMPIDPNSTGPIMTHHAPVFETAVASQYPEPIMSQYTDVKPSVATQKAEIKLEKLIMKDEERAVKKQFKKNNHNLLYPGEYVSKDQDLKSRAEQRKRDEENDIFSAEYKKETAAKKKMEIAAKAKIYRENKKIREAQAAKARYEANLAAFNGILPGYEQPSRDIIDINNFEPIYPHIPTGMGRRRYGGAIVGGRSMGGAIIGGRMRRY